MTDPERAEQFATDFLKAVFFRKDGPKMWLEDRLAREFKEVREEVLFEESGKVKS